MMRQGENDYSVGLGTIEKRKGEALEDDATRIGNGRRTREREGESPGRRFLDGSGEARPQTGLCLVVVSNFSQELLARFRNKMGAFHRAMRLASANTSSAG